MREIKFRVWTGFKMEYKIMVGFLGAFYVQGMDEKDSACMSPFNTIYPKEAPVMQFTGLKDKDDNDVFEGDILEYEVYYPVTGKQVFRNPVCFDEGKGAWCTEYMDGEYHYPGVELFKSAMKVIGNLYENPELLK